MAITRRQFIATVAAAGAVSSGIGVDGFLVEPERVAISRLRLATGASAGASAGTGARPGDSAATVTFVHLSDLHLQEVQSHERRVAAAVNALAPDFVVITGDSIDRRDKLPQLHDFLALLDARTPKFAILGNWEPACRVDLHALARVYAAANCRLLINETAIYTHGIIRVLITGLDDLLEGRANVAGALAGIEPEPNHLILAHCPVHRDVLRHVRPQSGNRWSGLRPQDAAVFQRFAPTCVLSGHTHGGQVNFFGFAPWRPRGSGRYISGWYRDVEPALYVSRGIGTIDLPIRIGAAPEVARFEWVLA